MDINIMYASKGGSVGRIQFFEIHDQEWFPPFLRDQMTEGLQAVFDFANLYAPVAHRLRRALDESGTTKVVDLCSGAGGPWQKLREACEEEFSGIQISLTDKYPNLKAIAKVHGGAQNGTRSKIEFLSESVDVRRVPSALAGFRTMFTSFHHFAPEEARAILRDAVENRQGIGIFEVPKRSWRTMLAVFLVPFTYLGAVPFLRPFRWSRLFWAYLLPVIPFTLWFDGIVSCLRAYTPSELMELTQGLSDDGYRWEAGEKDGSGVMPTTVTYLIGIPAARASQRANESVQESSVRVS